MVTVWCPAQQASSDTVAALHLLKIERQKMDSGLSSFAQAQCTSDAWAGGRKILRSNVNKLALCLCVFDSRKKIFL